MTGVVFRIRLLELSLRFAVQARIFTLFCRMIIQVKTAENKTDFFFDMFEVFDNIYDSVMGTTCE